jgi:solute:Na+ symporter, SSS family
VRGLIYAAIAGAVTSTLASLLNSASTIATMDVYRRLINQSATQSRLVWLGRALTVVCMLIGCALAPHLDDPKFGGVFNFIQQFQGYIWPGVVAAFVHAFLMPRAPGSAGVAALVLGPVVYGVFQFTAQSDKNPGGHHIHFLVQVLLTFLIVSAVMLLLTLIKPLPEPKRLPERAEISLETAPVVRVTGALVIAAVLLFFVVFR